MHFNRIIQYALKKGMKQYPHCVTLSLGHGQE